MTPATDFISQHIDQFGIVGTNNVVPGDFRRPVLPPVTGEFTKGNHLRFGFGDGEYNSRTSGSDLYWAKFGKSSRDHDGFLVELRRALSEVCDANGHLSITNSGNVVSRGLIATASEMGLPFEQTSIELDGHAPPPHDARIPNRLFQMNWDQFSDFAIEFASTAGCSDPWVALEAWHGVLSDRCHVYANARLVVVDHNFDYSAVDRIGPPNWGVACYERFTAISRWLLSCGRAGVPQITLWSPELIAAQIDSTRWRSFLCDASAEVPASMPRNEWWLSLARRPGLFRETYPDIEMAPTASKARNDEALNRKMAALRTRLRRANPGCDTVHYLPLHRVLRDLKIDLDFPYGIRDELYGGVNA